MCVYVGEQKPKKQRIDSNKFLGTGLSLSFLYFFLLEVISFSSIVALKGRSGYQRSWPSLLGLEDDVGSRLITKVEAFPCTDLCSDFSEQKPTLHYMVNTANPRNPPQLPVHSRNLFILLKLICYIN